MEQAILSTLLPRALRLALLFLLVATASVALAGDLPLKGVYKSSKQSSRTTEDGMLRADTEALRAMHSRTGLYLFVAESRADWERHVGPGLDDALTRSPEEVARFAASVPSGITALGPDIAGARVTFELPGDRGRGVIALHLGPRFSQSLGGIMGLSTYMCQPELLAEEAHPANQQTPVFMAHGEMDDVVPVAMGKAAYDTLTANQYAVSWQTYRMQHNVNMDEINAISQWLQARLA